VLSLIVGLVLGSGGTIGFVKLWLDRRDRRAEKTNEALKDYFTNQERLDECSVSVQRAVQQRRPATEVLPLLDAFRLAADRLFNTCNRLAINVRSGYLSGDDALVRLLASVARAMPLTYDAITEASSTYGHTTKLILDENKYTDLHRFLRGQMSDEEYRTIRDLWDHHVESQETKLLPSNVDT
jgi:hypothetical protein